MSACTGKVRHECVGTASHSATVMSCHVNIDILGPINWHRKTFIGQCKSVKQALGQPALMLSNSRKQKKIQRKSVK